jgi:hypothetical protein
MLAGGARILALSPARTLWMTLSAGGADDHPVYHAGNLRRADDATTPEQR